MPLNCATHQTTHQTKRVTDFKWAYSLSLIEERRQSSIRQLSMHVPGTLLYWSSKNITKFSAIKRLHILRITFGSFAICNLLSSQRFRFYSLLAPQLYFGSIITSCLKIHFVYSLLLFLYKNFFDFKTTSE